jgi:hypothetical protein
MYRQGLGDCFLITLQRDAGEPCHLLIDCGVLLGTPDAATTMTRVAHDIRRATRGHLNVVVVTHEHWDHVSGFLQARGVFEDMKIDEVWLAWTEDPADTVAESQRRERQRSLRGLRAVVGRLAHVDPGTASALQGLLGQSGAASGPSAREAVACLLEHPRRPRVRYLQAGTGSLELPGDREAQVYVLGPPRAATAPSGAAPTGLVSGLALFAASGGLASPDRNQSEMCQAFVPRYRLPIEWAETLPFFREHYLRRKDRWRRIDNDWLGTAEQLALSLDDHVGNTSLVLAVELEPKGRVLLFPGDTQVGEGSAWKDYRWRRAAPGPPVAALDLLSRTVLYKVGHHGSYTGTLRGEGLDWMSSPELTALLPVCRRTAERMGWNLPFPATLEQLRRKTRGRVLRSDKGIPDCPDEVSEREWTAFVQRVYLEPDGLYLEYTI